MGLDMLAYLTIRPLPQAVDFDHDEQDVEFHRWRKHPNLHGWMHELYRSKGGANPEFNLSLVQLELADLDKLRAAVMDSRLPETEGFFFGASDGSEFGDDILFISKACSAIRAGYSVFYYAWW